ncbi:MAG: APC family permease [Gordonia sp.]|nr:APC family permease [Gordonia sp. (in: high G+C Gram-positive bacteria)]
MTTSPTDSTKPTASNVLRSGALNTHHLVFFVVSAAAPLTTIAGFVALAFILGGEAAPAGYLIAGVVYALFAVGFTAMSRYVQNTGAFSAFISKGLGKTLGAGSAMVAYVGYAAGEIGFCAAAGLFASTALENLAGIDVHWGVCAVVIGIGVGVISYCKVNIGARVLALLLIAEVALLVLLSAAILIEGTPEGLSLAGFNPSTFTASSMGSLFIITFLVYVGFEQTAVYSEEAKNPTRTVPRATYIAVALLTVIYAGAGWVLLMAIGPNALADTLASGDPSALVFNINEQYLGTALTDVMQILLVTSFIAGVLALHNAASRYLFSLGRDGLLPAFFGRTSTTNNSPATAVIFQACLLVIAVAAFGFSSLDPYTQVVVWMNTPTIVGVLILQILTSIAVIRFFAIHRDRASTWHRLIAPGLAAVALVGVLYLVCTKMSLLTGLSTAGNILINLPLVVAFVIGVLRARHLARIDPEAYLKIGQAEKAGAL